MGEYLQVGSGTLIIADHGRIKTRCQLLATFLAILSYILALIAFVTFHHRADDNDADPDYGPVSAPVFRLCVCLDAQFE